ncbi:MAG: DUF4346 domain-containing protein [Nanobdellota archaeon]
MVTDDILGTPLKDDEEDTHEAKAPISATHTNGSNRKPPINKIEAKKDASMWEMDEKGYFLIDPRPEEEIIYAHHYTPDRKYNCSIAGETAEDIYYTIVREELVSSLLHAAYLGAELQKAELVVAYEIASYEQDRFLHINTDNEQEEEEE